MHSSQLVTGPNPTQIPKGQLIQVVVPSGVKKHPQSPGHSGVHIGGAAAQNPSPNRSVLHSPLQHGPLAVQARPADTHGAQVPLEEQLPLAHCLSCLHLAPSGLLGLAKAMPGMEASAPPTRAAPINLSALPLVRVPVASPLASSSRESSTPSPCGTPWCER